MLLSRSENESQVSVHLDEVQTSALTEGFSSGDSTPLRKMISAESEQSDKSKDIEGSG